MNLVFRSAAAADVEDAFDWYERRSAGLGERFLLALEDVIRDLLEVPTRYPVIHRQTRRVLVPSFPYALFYRIRGDDVIVVACFHSSRDPRIWRERP